jgi:hypothetical protein
MLRWIVSGPYCAIAVGLEYGGLQLWTEPTRPR